MVMIKSITRQEANQKTEGKTGFIFWAYIGLEGLLSSSLSLSLSLDVVVEKTVR
jgi:hypothetical protein